LLRYAKGKGLKVSFESDIDILESGIDLLSKNIYIGKCSKFKLGKGLVIKEKDIRAIVAVLSHEIGHYLTFEKSRFIASSYGDITKVKLHEELRASGHGLQLLRGFTAYGYSKRCLKRAYATYRRDYNRAHGIIEVKIKNGQAIE